MPVKLSIAQINDEIQVFLCMIPIILMNFLIHFLWVCFPYIIILIIVLILSIVCIKNDALSHELAMLTRH